MSLVRSLCLDLPSFISSFILYSFRRHRLLCKTSSVATVAAARTVVHRCRCRPFTRSS
ncbi:hypothetical protein GQ42DRAFT_164138 [Ramicandelaber brevisporus]|nr:hypothetical protein GQ42DRAFT_164138 [Ramicandelaber brevisporus]